ncbi:MAG: Smr/MutS family protein [Betaproteobacteria bacterium]|nr:Smr/MutS family protein [Betaproteobacteria bacterium]
MTDTDDREALRRALAGVKPLARNRRTPPHRPAPAPIAAQTLRDERAALAESLSAPLSIDDALESGVELSYLREGVSRQVLRRLRRGHWVVQDNLDLHGMNRVEAAAQVARFVRAAAARGLRSVRIVHGKGLGSRNREPVLKGKLRAWLTPRDEVLAFCQAPAAEGGAGALLVLLQAR